MYLFLIILFVLASILMCLIVLVQNSKGGGLASGFASSNQIMGVRKTTDFLEKATWGLAIFMVVMSVVVAYVVKSEPVENRSAIETKAVNDSKVSPTNIPDVSASQTTPEVPAATEAEGTKAE